MNYPLRALLVLAALPALGCVELDDRPASWTYVHAAVIAPNCTTSNCHSNLAATAGLDLSDREGAYLFLTGQVCAGEDLPGEPPRNFVDPGAPETSHLMYLLRGEAIRPMPPDTQLPAVEIDLVERWILEGAACD
jgi:hypothetical protein